ncbi:HET-domain-containing [Fusarium albosuccineum]|uniref:HET-domain-containing n=1 Tax=Fusarium albosuccineum TaxID=1237068 RepID=A0A8H4LCT2_9HYPO|nr:HET-domain-containing [Fusarium albosuccineum]
MDSSPDAENQQCPVDPTTRESDSAELQPETTSSRGAFCDGCDKDIYVKRHKCQDCPGFDYCSDGVVQASTTHPLHSFTSLDFHAPPEDLDNKQDNSNVLDKDFTNNSKVKACQCCSFITGVLPKMHLIPVPEGATGYKAVVPWSLRLSRLISASQLGCSFCTLVLDRIFGSDNITWFGYQPTKTWRAHPTKPDVQRDNLLQRVMRFLTVLKSDWFKVDVYPSYDPSPPNLTRLEIGLSPGTAEYQDPEELKKVFSRHGEIKFKVDVFASANDPASDHLRMRPPNPSPGTEASFLKVKQWMDHCDTNHEACQSSSRPTALPTRVLDVTLKGGLVRLHPATPGQLGRYTALSYCWGCPQICETTKANVSARLGGFSASELSSSLQDAIRITRALGIPYLWVDAICIIQDDKNPTLTICASRSQQAEKGFLQDWSDPDTGLWPTLIPLTYNLPSDQAKTADEAFDLPHKATGTVWIQDEDSYLTRKFNDHLSRRAWCLQERVLSPRVVEYSRWPCWRCNRESKVDLFTLNQLHGAWYKLLNEYTKRNISVSSDRLPAIGGIASRISQITGVKYVAGLWENNLLHDLMWKCSPGEWKHRPETWRAPSWSWASIEGPVSLTCIPDDSMPLASVIDCCATPIFNTKLPFGEVVDGKLTVRGPFSELKREDVLDLWRKQELAPAPPADNDVAKWQAAIWGFMTNDFTGQGKVEDDLDSLTERMFGLVTFSRESSEVGEDMSKSPSWSGLLLRQVPDGKYERIGMFLQEGYDWLDQVKKPWPTETIEVV